MRLKSIDREVYEAIKNEGQRQEENIELIASENFVSQAVLEAQGSVLTNKYAEGYPKRRYYGGCEFVDIVEELAIERLKKLFNVKYANVQLHSGSQANMVAYRVLINKGDTILGMSLDHGGHLTHGMKLNFSGKDYNIVSYGVDPKTEMIDYKEVLKIAKATKPKLIMVGASAYSREIDFKKFRKIADEVNAKLVVDMAHIAGLIAAGLHQSPVGYADIITSTTHKTLRGPRGGIVLTNSPEYARAINREVFPGIQGGPLMHVIAAKAVAFKEALMPEFKEYQKHVIKNANVFASELKKIGYKIISGGTDNHLFLVDMKSSVGLTGKEAEAILDSVNITCNKNTIPNDKEKPFVTSGVRFGTPAMTTRGFTEKEIIATANLIDEALRNYQSEEKLLDIKERVIKLTSQFPLNYK